MKYAVNMLSLIFLPSTVKSHLHLRAYHNEPLPTLNPAPNDNQMTPSTTAATTDPGTTLALAIYFFKILIVSISF